MKPVPHVFARRALLLVLAALVLPASLVAGCGGGGGSGDAEADPAEIAPKNALVYFTADVRPDGENREAVDAIARRVFRVSDPGKRIQQLIESEAKEEGDEVSYQDDIEPWLGDKAAVVFNNVGDEGSAGLILSVKDTDKAQEKLDEFAKNDRPKPVERKYKDVEYSFDPGDKEAEAIVGDYAVVADESVFKAIVDASKADGLASVAKFKEVADANEDKLGYGYVDVPALIRSASASGDVPAGQGQTLQRVLGALGDQPAALSLDAKPRNVTFEVTSGAAPRAAGDQAKSAQLISALPGESWLALAVPRLGQSLKQAVDQFGRSGQGSSLVDTFKQQLRQGTGLDVDRDLLAALGDVAVFAQGTGLLNLGAGAVIQAPDQAAATRLVTKLGPAIRRLAGSGSGITVGNASVAGAKGISVKVGRLPSPINIVNRGDRIVVAFGDPATEQALTPTAKLGDAPAFKTAQQSLGGALPSFFLSFAPVADLVASQSGANAEQVRQYLGALDTLAVGARTEGNRQIGRMVVALK